MDDLYEKFFDYEVYSSFINIQDNLFKDYGH